MERTGWGETDCAWQLVGLFVVVGVNLQPRQFHLQKIVQLKFFGCKTHVMVLSMRLGWTKFIWMLWLCPVFFRLFHTHSNKIISTYWSIDPWTTLYHVKGFTFFPIRLSKTLSKPVSNHWIFSIDIHRVGPLNPRSPWVPTAQWWGYLLELFHPYTR